MKVYLLRHGLADRDQWNGSDAERPLTSEGRKSMEREAKGMEELGVCPDRIVTSPKKRAKETAQIVAARLDMTDELVEDARLANGFNLERLAAILGTHADAKAVLLVGHEPSMSATLGRAIGAASIELKKAALAGFDIDDPNAPKGTLVCLIPPKVLVALGKR